MAIAAGDALRRAGIQAVLTGGACAHLYSAGRYHSIDADFVLTSPCARKDLDRALASLGFEREGDRYVHPKMKFFVEFPPGPLGIGEDFKVEPVWFRTRQARTLALSATDACRDRLAAYYHWKDRQALAAAVAIGVRNRLALRRIRRWSAAEGQLDSYDVFTAALNRAKERTSRGRRSPTRRAPS